LEYGQTYYWRVDEVNGAPDFTVAKGDVWSFTVEPYAYPITSVTATASAAQPASPASKTIDRSGLDELDQHGVDLKTMWVTPGGLPAWIQFCFDKVYKLHELWVWNANSELEVFMGFGAKDVTIEYSTDGETWTALENVPEFAQGTAKATYTANNIIDLGGVLAKCVRLTVNTTWGATGIASLSEVRFFYAPVQAFEPDPADGATGVSVNATLNWRPGREATSHEVGFGAAPDALTAQTVTDHSYTPAAMDVATKYYWKVNEVGDSGTFEGDVWSFTTQEYLVVDDFESYTDDMDAGEAVFQTWIDGYGVDTNGSLVGIDPAVGGTFCESTLIHSGSQSMPIFYDNSGGATYAEAKRTFDDAQNWKASGIKSLSLWFRGTTGNTGTLYIKINNTKVPYGGPATDIGIAGWQRWNIALAGTGANLSNVTTLTVGIEGAGAKGVLYVDDICLLPTVFETEDIGIDIAISTRAGWFGQAAADRETQEIVDNVPARIKVFTANDLDGLAAWVTAHTGDGASDLLILCGQFPDTIYGGANAQPDGSLAELFLDDGNTIINTGDYLFYVNTAGSNNAEAGIQNMMDIPTITMWDDDTAVTVTADGQTFTPALQDFATD
ncbi:MAG: discoidin domain-containing protein, partial [Phycisphaerales bacterium]